MFGLDFLGLAKFKDVAFREFPEGWALGFFDNTFGDALPAAERIIASGRCPLIRVHLLWSDRHSFGDSDIKKVRKLSRKYQALKQRHPNLIVEISPFCEHNLKNPDKYLDIVKQEAPDCIPVNTPDKGAFSKRYKNETHHSSKRPAGKYNFSYDGISAVDADVMRDKKTHSGADVFFFWIPQFNGRKTTKDTTPRPQRKAWPTSELIDSVIYLRKDSGVVTLPKNYLLKSHAEQHTTPAEPRAFKPVFIIPQKVNRVELVARNGQVIAVSSGPQPYEDGRWRYYFSQYGYQISEKAARIQGDGLVTAKIGNQQKFKLNAAFRGGSFR